MKRLRNLFSSLHDITIQNLKVARGSFEHPPTTGDAAQNVWVKLFNEYLPKRYRAASGQLIDCVGKLSDQIDVIIFDIQYTPPILHFSEQKILAVESVYAVFEVKQTLNDTHLKYAQAKAASVRDLYRTSLPIPHAGGEYQAKNVIPILAGILTLDSDWKPPLGSTFEDKLKNQLGHEVLDIGCIALHGVFFRKDSKCNIVPQKQAVPYFILELIAQLQALGTVAMVDTRAYAQWLSDPA